MNINIYFFVCCSLPFPHAAKPGYEKAIAEWVQRDSHGTGRFKVRTHWKCWKQKTSPYRTACAT